MPFLIKPFNDKSAVSKIAIDNNIFKTILSQTNYIPGAAAMRQIDPIACFLILFLYTALVQVEVYQ
jgi:hypothetical protein